MLISVSKDEFIPMPEFKNPYTMDSFMKRIGLNRQSRILVLRKNDEVEYIDAFDLISEDLGGESAIVGYLDLGSAPGLLNAEFELVVNSVY